MYKPSKAGPRHNAAAGAAAPAAAAEADEGQAVFETYLAR
jgi:hypothetical protein